MAEKHRIVVNLSPAESRRLDQRLSALGITHIKRAAYVRRLLLDEPLVPGLDLVNQMRAIANDVAQGNAPVERLEELFIAAYEAMATR